MIVHANSWHYQLLGAFEVNIVGADSCTYRRKLITLLLLLAAGGTIVLYSVGDFIGWLLGCVTNGCAEPTLGAVLILLSLGIAAVVCGVAATVHLHEMWRGAHPIDPDAPPSFVKQSYRQWRDKYCTKVEVRY